MPQTEGPGKALPVFRTDLWPDSVVAIPALPGDTTASMDALVKTLSESACIRCVWVDVSQAAKALEARHLCGPTSALVLGQALADAALLASDLAGSEEAACLQVRVSGPVRGVVTEATGAGGLRGFTYTKVMNELDQADEIRVSNALGASGKAQVTFSEPGRIMKQSVLPATPPDLRALLARYYNVSAQTPAGVALSVRADSGGLLHARGVVVERMPDGSHEPFADALEAFERGDVAGALREPPELGVMAQALGLEDLRIRETRGLRFECRCSQDKTEALLDSLPVAELESMAEAAKPQRTTCHMCGQDYTVTAAVIQEKLAARRA